MGEVKFLVYCVVGVVSILLILAIFHKHFIKSNPDSILSGSRNFDTNTNTSPTYLTNQISSNQANNNLSSEFVDPLPLYSPPARSAYSQIPSNNNVNNTSHIQISIPPQEVIDRPPTYRV